MAFKLIVFDLDGTLADTKTDLADSVNELRRRLRLKSKSITRVSLHVGQGVKHLLHKMMPALTDAQRQEHPDLYTEFTRIYIRRCTHRTKLYPGTHLVLRRMPAGAVLAVATNKLGPISRTILRRLRVLGRFKAVVGGDEMRIRKPHPAVLVDLMKRFRARPSETVMVGDSRFDMETGKRAKVRTVACTFGFGSRAELQKWKPDVFITRMAALPAALVKLSAQKTSR